MRWFCPSPLRYYYPLGISRLIADVRSCFADVLSIAPRRHTACGALDRSRCSPPRSRSVSTMPGPITQYDFSLDTVKAWADDGKQLKGALGRSSGTLVRRQVAQRREARGLAPRRRDARAHLSLRQRAETVAVPEVPW